MKFYKIAVFTLLLSTKIFADFQSLVDNPNRLLDLIQKLVNSKQELDQLKNELEKVPLFLKGCKMVKLTDPRYPFIKVVNKNIILKDSTGREIPAIDPKTGHQAVDEQGQLKFKKLTIACDDLKDALSGVEKLMEFIETKLLGTAELTAKGAKDKAIFVDFFEVIGQKNKVPDLYELSKTIESLRFFINRVDKVLKIERKKAAQSSAS